MAQIDNKVLKAFEVISKQRKDILLEGKQLGIVDKNLDINIYVPKYTPAPKVLKVKSWFGIKKEPPLRKDILVNAVLKQQLFESMEEAEKILDGWINFIESNGYIDSENKWIQYLFNTNQAKTSEEAREKTLEEFQLNKDFILGNLLTIDRPIILDFPFWDPDPRRFWLLFLRNSAWIIAGAKHFGSDRKTLHKLINEIKEEQGYGPAQEAEKLSEEDGQELKRKSRPIYVKDVIRMYGFI